MAIILPIILCIILSIAAICFFILGKRQNEQAKNEKNLAQQTLSIAEQQRNEAIQAQDIAKKINSEADSKLYIVKNYELKNVREQTEIDTKLAEAKKELDFNLNKVKEVREQLEESQKSFKETSEEAAENYFKVLEQSYIQEEEKYKERIDKMMAAIAECQSDLDKIRESRAAANEAIRQEQLVKENKDAYRLNLSERALKDIRLLKSIQSDISNAIVIDKIIWSNYYQPLAKIKFPKIIGKATVCGIYKITCLITDECYIGQSKDCCDRWKQHCKNALGVGSVTTQNKLYQAIKEYGLNNFTFEIIEECKSECLDEREKYYISLYDSYNFGLNGNQGNG